MKEVNLLVDVSGSILESDVTKVLKVVFNKFEKINFIQFDTEVRSITKISKDSEIPKLVGGGGTYIQPALDLIVEDSNYKKLDTYIFTDGYTEKASFFRYENNIIYLKPHHSTSLNILVRDKSKFKTINL